MDRLRNSMITMSFLALSFVVSGNLHADGNHNQTPWEDSSEVLPVPFNQVDESETTWMPDEPGSGKTWSVLMEQSRSFRNAQSQSAPVIMMAGYMDTDISWRYGGIFRMLAWVWDVENDVETVEIYYEGLPTGVFLYDDGNNGDFEAGDSLFGLSIEIPPQTLTPGDYQLELRAFDSMDNASDLWPYLTIHD